MKDDKVIESWWRFYDSQITHSRHHETLRSQSTTVIITVSLGVVAYITKGDIPISNRDEAIVWIFVAILNIFGFLISVTHTVRSRIHISVAKKVREAITPHILLDGASLRDLRDQTHASARPNFSRFPSLLWPGIHLVIVVSALYMWLHLTVATIFF